MSSLEPHNPTTANGAGPVSDSYRLIALLLAGTIERIRLAQTCHRRGDLPGRARALFAAATSVEGLRLSLDHEAGGEIAAGLETLYMHTTAHLVTAGQGDADSLDQAQSLLQNIASAWAAISPSQMNKLLPASGMAAHERAGTPSQDSRFVREDRS